MISKGFTFIIVQLLFIVQAITAHPCNLCEESPRSYGGAFLVATGSPVPPTGISVLSENSFEGMLSVEGRLPFIGTVGLEGVLPTAGAGAVSYGCGNGNVAMVSEDLAPAGFAGRSVGAYGCAALL